VADRIEKAWSELLQAFQDGEALAAEMSTDYVSVTNAHGYVALDRRFIPSSLPAVLGFGTHGKVFKLAERWRALRGKV
jgi:hypothetical protein